MTAGFTKISETSTVLLVKAPRALNTVIEPCMWGQWFSASKISLQHSKGSIHARTEQFWTISGQGTLLTYSIVVYITLPSKVL